MDIEIIGDKHAANEILFLMKLWDKSVEECNSSELAKGYAGNVEMFDIGCQLAGRDKLKDLWQSCFPYFGESPKVSRRKFKIYASEELAFIHCYSKICGSNMPDPGKQPWCRATVCLQKSGTEWNVVHEHISMPIDFQKGVPALIIGEP